MKVKVTNLRSFVDALSYMHQRKSEISQSPMLYSLRFIILFWFSVQRLKNLHYSKSTFKYRIIKTIIKKNIVKFYWLNSFQ